MSRSGPRKTTLAKGLANTGQTLQDGKHARHVRLITEHVKKSAVDAEMIWELIEQDMVRCLRSGVGARACEKPLSGSQLKINNLPAHVWRWVLQRYSYMPDWFKVPTNMKKLVAKDPKVYRKLILAITREDPDRSLSAGTVASEATAWLLQKAESIGNRLEGIEIDDDGVVHWHSVSAWCLSLEENAVVLKHRFLGNEAIRWHVPFETCIFMWSVVYLLLVWAGVELGGGARSV